MFLRIVLLDVAVITNASSRTIEIDDVYGVRVSSNTIRSYARSQALQKRAPERLSMQPRSLAPGEGMIVPLRIMLAVSDDLRERAGKAGRKGPRLTNYVYGPETAILGFSIDGERIDLSGNSANLLALTSSCECGSCPYLYVWSDDQRRWRNMGKVIHTAEGQDKQATETRSFDGFTRKVRLVEQEPELAFVDQVEMVVSLTDGRRVTLRPQASSMRLRDGVHERILYGQVREIAFALPAGISETDVEKSEISVTGYYERYSTIVQKDVFRRDYVDVLPIAKSGPPRERN